METVVAMLRGAGAVREDLLRSPGHFCGKFRVSLGRGYADPTCQDIWLVPIKPEFFWGEDYTGVGEEPSVIVLQRSQTGLADFRWVSSLNGERGVK